MANASRSRGLSIRSSWSAPRKSSFLPRFLLTSNPTILPSRQRARTYGERNVPHRLPLYAPLAVSLLMMCRSPLWRVCETRTRFSFLVAAAFALALTAQGTNAGSFDLAAGVLKESGAGSNLKQKAHGCHYSCECGPPDNFGLCSSTTADCTCSASRSVATGVQTVPARRPKAYAGT